MWIFCFSVLLTKGTGVICSFRQLRWFCQKQCINLFGVIVRQLEAKGFLMPTLRAGNQKSRKCLVQVHAGLKGGWRQWRDPAEGGRYLPPSSSAPCPQQCPFCANEESPHLSLDLFRTDFMCWLDTRVFNPRTLWMPYHLIIIISNQLFSLIFGVVGFSPGRLATGRYLCLRLEEAGGTGMLAPAGATVLPLQLTDKPRHLALSKALSQIPSPLSPHYWGWLEGILQEPWLQVF